MKTFLFGLLLGIFVVPLVAYAYFMSGSAPVATSAPPMPFERMLAGSALNARIAKEMPKTSPIPAEEATYSAGAQIYRENCAVCHGLGFQQSLSETQMWQVSLLLANADKLPDSVKQALVAAPAAPQSVPSQPVAPTK